MLIDKKILKNVLSPSGYHIVLEYIFDHDKVTYELRGSNPTDAQTFLTERESSAIEAIQFRHASEAFSLGITSEYKEASESLVKYQYLKAGLLETEPYEAYETMVKVAPDIMALGLTVEQMAQMFGETVENAQATFDKWTYLDVNKDIITAYRGL